MEHLAIKNLSFCYPRCEEAAVKHVDFTVERGEFAVLCGETGSGKSTLLRLLKKEIAPSGEQTGEILIGGKALSQIPSEAIGFVAQRPDEQIVTDKVYAELAFGPENLGLAQSVIARRVAEMASYFGIEDWFDRDTSTLSGGQKQLLSLASVMVMHPEILLLDEPTSQLDPIAASAFLETLKRLNRDFSITVLIAEHRLEDLIPMCDRVLVMQAGELFADGTPREVCARGGKNGAFLAALPTAVRLYHALKDGGPCPLTVREGRQWMEARYQNRIDKISEPTVCGEKKEALVLREVYFRYARRLPDVLKGLSLTVYEGEIFCILGGNGSGKTTALACAAGLERIYSGEIRVFGKRLREYAPGELYHGCLTLLSQDVQDLFLFSTVREELAEAGAEMDDVPFDLTPLLDKHPYDLSGGEAQMTALAKVLATKPRLLLLDEPTKGLDAEKKSALIGILRALRAKGVTILLVTHDVEFAAMCSDRCALFFRGEIVSISEPRAFFSENRFYTTAASRMTRGYFENAVTVEDIVTLCQANGRRGDFDA